ncbi:EutP/PduV family microcompartment system protein [Silvimonas iriomotensis]|uniref:Ethanolamine utilization protein EutP n=1 Tax=Silvimonas iriomotensis TaxID=449662 RepID=A0ABQ2PBD3_9NEIS|nr:EutP/PduV family microcompartment system protein [Silvimonas iriomotensis]GGP22532.1 ethanolamine utilization protein EutP [Silvimonas iriomotensis]
MAADCPFPRFALVGSIEAGKSTLFNALHGRHESARKTQAVEFDQTGAIDTPGEFFNHPRLYHALINTITDVDVLVYVHPANLLELHMPPGLLEVYHNKRLFCVISKIDLPDATPARVENLLRERGFDGEIFQVSSQWPETVAALKAALTDSHRARPLPHGVHQQ